MHVPFLMCVCVCVCVCVLDGWSEGKQSVIFVCKSTVEYQESEKLAKFVVFNVV